MTRDTEPGIGTDPESVPRAPQTIVIAEDDALIAGDIAHELERNGLAVLAVTRTAEETVAAVRAHAPDLVFLDINLAGGSSGIEAAERLAADDGRRCVFFSGELDAATRARLHALDPIAVLSKPLLTSQILDAVAASPGS